MTEQATEETATIEENGRQFSFIYNEAKGGRLTGITENGKKVNSLTFPHFLIPWDKAREAFGVQS